MSAKGIIWIPPWAGETPWKATLCIVRHGKDNVFHWGRILTDVGYTFEPQSASAIWPGGLAMSVGHVVTNLSPSMGCACHWFYSFRRLIHFSWFYFENVRSTPNLRLQVTYLYSTPTTNSIYIYIFICIYTYIYIAYIHIYIYIYMHINTILYI